MPPHATHFPLFSDGYAVSGEDQRSTDVEVDPSGTPPVAVSASAPGLPLLDGAAATSTCGVTILRTGPERFATKQWKRDPARNEWSKQSYDAGGLFRAEERLVANLDALVQVIEEARRDPRAFVVRGELAAWVRQEIANDPGIRIRRLKHARKDGSKPTLVEVPRRWIMVDIDNWLLPIDADLAADPDAMIALAIKALLPEAFQEATCWWQLSASAGFVAGLLKAHLFFWLAEPASNEHLKAVFKQHAADVDRAPFNAVQPHFIADPIIMGGEDPLPRRTGWLRRPEAAVQLPALQPVIQKKSAPNACAPDQGEKGRDVLALMGDGAGRQGFHQPLLVVTMRYAQQARRNRNDRAFKNQLREAIQAAPCLDGRSSQYLSDDTLQRYIDGAFARLAGNDIQIMQPHYPAPKYTVSEARAVMKQQVSDFLQRSLNWLGTPGADRKLPEHAALKVGVGIGKSTTVRRGLSAFIRDAKARGLPRRVLWLMPMHELGNEVLADLHRLGVSAAVMRGRRAEQPGSGDATRGIRAQTMCGNLDAVDDALKIGQDIEQAVCGSGRNGDPSCPFRMQCPYQQQKDTVDEADVVIATHQSLFHPLSKAMGHDLGLVVIDEAWWQTGLEPGQSLPLAGFADEPIWHPVLRMDRTGRRHDTDTNCLHDLSAKLQKVFQALKADEFVSREAVLAAGLTADACAGAVKLEWRRIVKNVLSPGMSLHVRKRAVDRAAGNASIKRRAGVWRELEHLLRGKASHSGRLQSVGAEPARTMLLHERRDICGEIAALPILYLDATMPVKVVQYFLPRLNVVAEIDAIAPHMEVHQIGGGWGKSTLTAANPLSGKENQHSRLNELTDFVRLNSGGDALVVTYKDIEDRFAGPGVQTGHFNAIAGLNAYDAVRSLFVIGRPLPSPCSLRATALALTGQPIPLDAGHHEARGALMSDGSGLAVSTYGYATPILQALKEAITDAEIIQAIGRGRGVNRSEESPLTVFICADVVLPVPVARVTQWDDVCPDILSRMLARHAILLSPTDAAKAYPELFPTVEAAKKALQRAKPDRDFGDISVGESVLGECPRSPLIRVSYRPAGSGQQLRAAYVSEERLPTFREWLEALVGPLARYALTSPQAVPATAAASPAAVSSIPATIAATGRPTKASEAVILFFKPRLSVAQAMDLEKRGVVPLITLEPARLMTVRSGLAERSLHGEWSCSGSAERSSRSVSGWSGSAAA